MSRNAHPDVLNALADEFGPNAGLALELYATYRLNPAPVEARWRRAFEAAEGRAAVRAAVSRASHVPVPVPAPAVRMPEPITTTVVVPRPPAPPAPTPALRAGEEAVPLLGGAATVARNMEASLAVPTATSNRMIPAKTMEENRR